MVRRMGKMEQTSRRQFLKGAAKVAAAVVAGPLLGSRAVASVQVDGLSASEFRTYESAWIEAELDNALASIEGMALNSVTVEHVEKSVRSVVQRLLDERLSVRNHMDPVSGNIIMDIGWKLRTSRKLQRSVT